MNLFKKLKINYVMLSCNFEEKYKNHILPKYGKFRNITDDEIMFSKSVLPNKFDKIIDTMRVDLTHLDIISIDPPGCSDADDAFSIYSIEDKLYLAIHIADPTYYIDLESDLWKDILNRAITHYPSNNYPIHMMPNQILEKSSLMTDNVEFKNAITVTFEINLETFLPTNNIKLEFTKIKVKKENKFTYLEASLNLHSNEIFYLGSLISKSLKNKRSQKTIGTKLSEIDILIPSFDNNNIFIKNTDINEKIMKEMIGEFAILTNSFIGFFIKNNMNGLGIYRTCEASSILSSDTNICAIDILNKIIEEGIKAEYSSNDSVHDLVGINLYCHFTSPIRRVTDCICHFLIKAYYTNLDYPWTENELTKISKSCLLKSKKEKSIQYDDNKFRIIQLIDKLLLNNKVKISFRINSYTGLFLNCIINKIYINDKEYNTHLSYTLRNNKLNIDEFKKDYIIEINNVLPFEKFDGGCIPDLDNFINLSF